MRTISVIGNSGSGKTHFITSATKLLKESLSFHVAVIKYIHEHEIDEEGKDTHEFGKYGATYAITKNIKSETAIFVKNDLNIVQLIEWISKGPFNIDVIFTEGFRNLNYPSVVCLKDLKEFESQKTNYIKTISGLVAVEDNHVKLYENLPIINIEKDFNKFLDIFNLKS